MSNGNHVDQPATFSRLRLRSERAATHELLPFPSDITTQSKMPSPVAMLIGCGWPGHATGKV